MSPLESQLLVEISKLQTSLSGNTAAPLQQASIPSMSPAAILTEGDVRRIVQEVLSEEVNALKDSFQAAQAAQSAQVAPESNQPTIQDAVNLALNEEERNWLLQNNNYTVIEQKLPQFLMTEDGQLAIQSLFIYLRGNI